MPGRIRSHIQGNVVGYLALFVALTGSAYAAVAPNNSVSSKSIKRGQVKASDLGANSVSGPKVGDGSLSGVDLGDGSLSGADVGDGSLSKSDLAGGQFGSAPATATYASHDPVDFRVPDTPVTQVIASGDQTGGDSGGALIHLSAPGRVLASASLQFINSDSNAHAIFCRFGIAPTGSPTPTPFGQQARQTIPGTFFQQLPLAAAVIRPAGDYFVNVGCSADSATGSNVQFDKGDLTVWALPAQ